MVSAILNLIQKDANPSPLAVQVAQFMVEGLLVLYSRIQIHSVLVYCHFYFDPRKATEKMKEVYLFDAPRSYICGTLIKIFANNNHAALGDAEVLKVVIKV